MATSRYIAKAIRLGKRHAKELLPNRKIKSLISMVLRIWLLASQGYNDTMLENERGTKAETVHISSNVKSTYIALTST